GESDRGSAEDRSHLEKIAADRTERPQRNVMLARERAHLVLARRLDHQNNTRGRFSEQRDALVDPADRGERHLHADSIPNDDLRERDGEATRVAIVRRADRVLRVRREEEALEATLEREVDGHRPFVDAARRPVSRRAERYLSASREQYKVTGSAARRRDVLGDVGEPADRADDGSRPDVRAVR